MFKLYIFISSALFVTVVISGNSTLTERDRITNSTSNGTKMGLLNKQSLVSEGGTLLPNISNFASLMSIHEELSKTKEKAVVPRKGVDNLLANIKADNSVETMQLNSNKTVLFTPIKLNTTEKNSSAISYSKDIHSTSTLLNKTSVEPKKANSTEAHKKPMILSYEALVNMEKNIQSDEPKIAVSPSTKTMTSSQIPSPNEDSVVKVYPSKANSHPGMIMPIVITILVVPMFAIVGYMALRRGQEAWKNRHYKRMDFLLDGMYND